MKMRQALSAQLLGSHLDVQMWSWVGGTRTAQKTLLWEKEAQTLCWSNSWTLCPKGRGPS